MVEHLNDGMSASRNSNIAPGSRLNHVLDVKRVIALAGHRRRRHVA